MSDKTDQERRNFLFSISGAAVAAAGGSIVVPACGTGMNPGDGGGSSFVATGLTVNDVAMGAVAVAPAGMTGDPLRNPAAVLIGRDAGGFYALDLVCSHQGCAVNRATGANPISCACHMSEFSATGDVVRMATGATTQAPLPMFTIQFMGTGTAAAIQVNKSMPVTNRTQRFMPT